MIARPAHTGDEHGNEQFLALPRRMVAQREEQREHRNRKETPIFTRRPLVPGSARIVTVRTRVVFWIDDTFTGDGFIERPADRKSETEEDGVHDRVAEAHCARDDIAG